MIPLEIRFPLLSRCMGILRCNWIASELTTTANAIVQGVAILPIEVQHEIRRETWKNVSEAREASASETLSRGKGGSAF